MRRVAYIPVLLVMAAVASSASVATTGVRAQATDRTELAAIQPAARSLSPRSAAQPTIMLPSFHSDPFPILTEFYGPAKTEAPKPEQKRPSPQGVPEAVARP